MKITTTYTTHDQSYFHRQDINNQIHQDAAEGKQIKVVASGDFGSYKESWGFYHAETPYFHFTKETQLNYNSEEVYKLLESYIGQPPVSFTYHRETHTLIIGVTDYTANANPVYARMNSHQFRNHLSGLAHVVSKYMTKNFDKPDNDLLMDYYDPSDRDNIEQNYTITLGWPVGMRRYNLCNWGFDDDLKPIHPHGSMEYTPIPVLVRLDSDRNERGVFADSLADANKRLANIGEVLVLDTTRKPARLKITKLEQKS